MLLPDCHFIDLCWAAILAPIGHGFVAVEVSWWNMRQVIIVVLHKVLQDSVRGGKSGCHVKPHPPH